MDFSTRVLQRTEPWVAPLNISVRSREEPDLPNGFGDSKFNPRLTMIVPHSAKFSCKKAK
jgi:hypothetical protein